MHWLVEEPARRSCSMAGSRVARSAGALRPVPQNSLITTSARTLGAIDSGNGVMRQPGPHANADPAGPVRPRPPNRDAKLVYRPLSSASYGSRLPDFARPRESR
ncbi:MAG: hypothetical protein QOH46_873 [Solirubrobacteraceae bacterium]|jgi:hypothetical protein|nr:hypothetical protein [Solirubrobacteraceae bacterium]